MKVWATLAAPQKSPNDMPRAPVPAADIVFLDGVVASWTETPDSRGLLRAGWRVRLPETRTLEFVAKKRHVELRSGYAPLAAADAAQLDADLKAQMAAAGL